MITPIRGDSAKACLGLTLLLAIALGARAQSTVAYHPAHTDFGPDPITYAIDINGDGVADFAFSITSGGGNYELDIIPLGGNAVLCHTNTSAVCNLPQGATVGPQCDGLWWNGGGAPLLVSASDTAGPQGGGGIITPFSWGDFAWTNGFIGLRLGTGNNEVHYGFLQLDCSSVAPGSGGLYLGCGWNSTPSEPIATSPLPPLLRCSPSSAFITSSPPMDGLLVSWSLLACTNYSLQVAATPSGTGGWTTITNAIFTDATPPSFFRSGFESISMSFPGNTRFCFYSLTNAPSSAFFRMVPK